MEKVLLERMQDKNVKLIIETIMPTGERRAFASRGRVVEVLGETVTIVDVQDKLKLFRLDMILGVEEF